MILAYSIPYDSLTKTLNITIVLRKSSQCKYRQLLIAAAAEAGAEWQQQQRRLREGKKGREGDVCTDGGDQPRH
ncbi:hypothetical protein E2C01_056651 [Portunus trituberculatus]|uniref:Uncharacterized protein n=1 Tax=Portunus trituberculatus TaxID=210409 RepID=A0A5B7GYT4_PORTR|nr:hypothetical protein [Portunus trituberculatus]